MAKFTPRFHSKLVMTPIEGQRMWILQESLIYESAVLGGLIEVPAGFVCDLNSIPRIFWWVSPPTDYPEAGVIHDFGYRYKLFPRKLVDDIYREALQVTHAGPVRRFLRYWGVRLGGRRAYRQPIETT